MGDLSEHFGRREFACGCGCGEDTVDAELVRVLEDLRRRFFGRPIRINSGCRCEVRNHEEGGAADSQHLYGKAADIVIVGVLAEKVADCLEGLYPDRYGIGRYSGWTHIDVRSGKARWGKRKG